MVNYEERITKIDKRDDSNNIVFDDIGAYLKKTIVGYAQSSHSLPLSLKYIDPTYSIRSVPSNAIDTSLCAKLAQNAVHGSMAGYTGFSVGTIRNTVAMIPINTLIEAGVNRINLGERTWQRLMA